MRTLSIFILVAIAAAAACTTKPNAAVCCVSEADCARLGLDEPRPCEVGQACKAFACVAAECSSSADCASPEAPVCVDNLCVATCRVDDDCAGAAGGPRCAADGVCVGCLASADCAASAPFCDAEDRSCRGCELDAECASGVCLEMDARCTSEDEVIFVTMFGQDDGECTRSAPCLTIQYAMTKARYPSRLVIHLVGGSFSLGADLTVDGPIDLDGSNTAIDGNVHVTSIAGPVTIANVTMGSGSAITVAATSSARVFNSSVARPIETTGGTLIARRSRFLAGSGISCTSGTVTIEECRFDDAAVGAANCQLAVSGSVFDANGARALGASGGRITLENNLIIQSYELADTVVLGTTAPGSTVRFNTFVNTSTLPSDGVALYCDSTLEVTSNVFAYGSMHPHGTSTCTSRYSLYDAVALPEQTDGVGNRVADGATFFASKASRDFHLAPASPARGAAEPGTGVTRDLEGRLRPSPIGSVPDMGALEAP